MLEFLAKSGMVGVLVVSLIFLIRELKPIILRTTEVSVKTNGHEEINIRLARIETALLGISVTGEGGLLSEIEKLRTARHEFANSITSLRGSIEEMKKDMVDLGEEVRSLKRSIHD